MGDLKLFRLRNGSAIEIPGSAAPVEKSIQTLAEKHLREFFAIDFLATEYGTGKIHGGRIDTLGIDENNAPVIIEYKRSMNQNVINQGLFYLDWLLDHKHEFQGLVEKRLGRQRADSIDWTQPRLLCVASDFTRFDEHAVRQIERNIQLVRYRRHGEDLLMFELVNTVTAPPLPEAQPVPGKRERARGASNPTFLELLAKTDARTRDTFEALRAWVSHLGDDVQETPKKYYLAFKRLKNFACLEVHPNKRLIVVFVKGDPRLAASKPGFLRDVSNIGHYGTGDLEINVRSMDDLDLAKPLIQKSYEAN